MSLELYFIILKERFDVVPRLRRYHAVVWPLALAITVLVAALGWLGGVRKHASWSGAGRSALSAGLVECRLFRLPLVLDPARRLGHALPPVLFVARPRARSRVAWCGADVPMLLLWLASAALYCVLIHRLWGAAASDGARSGRRVLCKLGLFPLVFLCTWVWAIVNRWQQVSWPERPHFAAGVVAVAELHACARSSVTTSRTSISSCSTPPSCPRCGARSRRWHTVATRARTRTQQGLLDALTYGATNRLVRRACVRALRCRDRGESTPLVDGDSSDDERVGAPEAGGAAPRSRLQPLLPT